MALAFRYYLFREDAPQRLSKKRLEGLVSGRERMPQFARTRQRNVEVVLEVNGRRPLRIVRATGSFFHFDQDGALDFQTDALTGLMDIAHTLTKAKNTPASKVIDLTPHLRHRKWEREYRWQLSKEQLDLIAKDLWKT